MNDLTKKKKSEFLLGQSLKSLEQFAINFGQKSFRGRQIYDWLYKKGARNLDEISVLPKDWKLSLLSHGVVIGRLKEIDRRLATDNTIKLLLGTDDGGLIETVGIPTSNRLTVCLSSQIGCSMGCKFCATGKDGLQRSLRLHEIIDQVLSIHEAIGRRPSNIVFMGMGEPLLNMEVVVAAIRCLNFDLGIGQRRITVSTVGIPQTIPRLAEYSKEILGNAQFTLAVSLHAPNQELRESLIPSASSFHIEELLSDCKNYFFATGRRVSFEYILLGDVNDTSYHSLELANLLRGFNSHVNLIPYNPVADVDYRPPRKQSILLFKDNLQKRGIPVSIRASRGLDQDAACGQLRRNKQNF